MFHYVNAITNTKGDALIGYYVRLRNSAGEAVSIFADESSTPILSVSGLADAATVDSNGNVSFYVADGEYTVEIYATDGTTFVDSYDDIPMAKIGMLKAASVSELADLDTAYPAILTEEGVEGIFIFRSDDLSVEVSGDPEQHTYVAPSSDDTGASGAWFRVTSAAVQEDAPQSGVVSGLGVAYNSLLTFDMAAGSYYLDGVLHTADAQSITLTAAHATLNRIDVLYLDTEGVLQKLDGTAAASPSKPAVDPSSQLELTFVVLPAAATSLSGVTTEDIYLENTEWTTSQSAAAFTLASTNNPYAGTKDIEVTGTFATNGTLTLTRASNLAFGGDGNLIFRIRSKATWAAKRWFTLHFMCDGVNVGLPVSFKNGTFGFDSSVTSAYQIAVISKSLFSIAAGTEIDALRITAVGSGGSAISFYLDNIQLQTNGAVIGNSDFTQSVADARYVNVTGDTMTGDLVVPAEAYGVGWNGSNEVPTKNDVYDKIETISGGSLGALLAANNLSDVNSAATSRTNLGVGTGDSPQFTALNIGHASDTTISRTGAGDIAVEGNAVYRAGGTDVPVTDGGTGASDASTARTNLGLGTAAILAETTSAEYRNNTADRALSTDQVWGAAGTVALSESGGNVAVDLNSGINFTLAMTGNWTLSSPSNEKVGQTGFIRIAQDGTGSRTLAYGSEWKFAGGTDPVLSTAASSVDILFYMVVASGEIYANLIKAIA